MTNKKYRLVEKNLIMLHQFNYLFWFRLILSPLLYGVVEAAFST